MRDHPFAAPESLGHVSTWDCVEGFLLNVLVVVGSPVAVLIGVFWPNLLVLLTFTFATVMAAIVGIVMAVFLLSRIVAIAKTLLSRPLELLRG